MSKKVKLAIFDSDLKARTVKKYPVTDDGSKIRVVSGGENHFMPSFDNDSFIEFPRRSLLPPFGIKWDRVYFARKKAKKCVNFKTGEVPGPDPELVKKAAGMTMLTELGKDKTDIHPLFYIMLLILLGIALKVFGVIV